MKRAHSFGLFLPALTVILVSTARAQAPSPDAFQISVSVDLVELHPVVRDSKGHFIADLRAQDFEVYEDGVLQTIKLFQHEDVPVTVGLVIDHSGSMGNKISHVIAAAETFVQASRPDDEMFVVNFNEHVTIGLAAGTPFTSRANELALAIANAPVTGQTALYDAVLEAQQQLKTGTKDKKVLVVISDGGDNRSSHPLTEVLNRAAQSNALIYAIGIFDEGSQDQNPSVLKKLSGTTGGEAFFPEDLKDVVKICGRIAGDIRNQYTLSYVSNSAHQSGYHSIRVVAHTADHQKLVVRTRSGYIQ